jgi:hypothetical protein
MVAPHAGILEKIELPHWTDPMVRSVELFKRPGDLIHPPFENTDRMGCVMACGTSRADTERVAQRFVDETKIILK